MSAKQHLQTVQKKIKVYIKELKEEYEQAKQEYDEDGLTISLCAVKDLKGLIDGLGHGLDFVETQIDECIKEEKII